MPNWLLKEYSHILALPITQILNALYLEQRLPAIWKMADISPLPKKKVVLDLKKDLRPVSLTQGETKIKMMRLLFGASCYLRLLA